MEEGATRRFILATSLLAAVAQASCGQDPPTPALKEISQRMTYFYAAPSQDEFESLQLEIRAHSDELERQGLGVLTAVFLARVHAKHGWPIVDLGDLTDQAHAIAAQDESDLSRYVHDDARVDPSKLDIWWGSFFATGETQYLDKIVGQVGDLDSKSGADILVTGAANWSFEANYRQHAAVRGYAKRLLERDPPQPNREKILEIVEKAKAP